MPDHENGDPLVRTSVMVREDTDAALRRLADANHRPLSWEIRLALEAHVDAQTTRRQRRPAGGRA